jgi:hypothetical protein
LGPAGPILGGNRGEGRITEAGERKVDGWLLPANINQDDKREVHRRHAIRAFQTTFLIGRDGKIREQNVGTLGEAAPRKKVAALIDEALPHAF